MARRPPPGQVGPAVLGEPAGAGRYAALQQRKPPVSGTRKGEDISTMGAVFSQSVSTEEVLTTNLPLVQLSNGRKPTSNPSAPARSKVSTPLAAGRPPSPSSR